MGESETRLLLRLLDAAVSAGGCWPAIRDSLEEHGIDANDIERVNQICADEGLDPLFETEDFE